MNINKDEIKFRYSDDYSIILQEHSFAFEDNNLSLFDNIIKSISVTVSCISLDYVGSNYPLYFCVDFHINDKHFYMERHVDNIEGIIDENEQYFDDRDFFNTNRKNVLKSFDDAFDSIYTLPNQYFVSNSQEFNSFVHDYLFSNDFSFVDSILFTFINDYKKQFLNLYLFIKTQDILYILECEKLNSVNQLWYTYDKNIFSEKAILQLSELPYLDIFLHNSIIYALHTDHVFKESKNLIINEKNISELTRFFNLSKFDLIPYLKDSKHLEDFVFETKNDKLIQYFFEDYISPSNLQRYSNYFNNSFDFFKNFTLEDYKIFLTSDLKRSILYFNSSNLNKIENIFIKHSDLFNSFFEDSSISIDKKEHLINFIIERKGLIHKLDDNFLFYFYKFILFHFTYKDYIFLDHVFYVSNDILTKIIKLVPNYHTSKVFMSTLLFKNIINEDDFTKFYSKSQYIKFSESLIVKEKKYLENQILNF